MWWMGANWVFIWSHEQENEAYKDLFDYKKMVLYELMFEWLSAMMMVVKKLAIHGIGSCSCSWFIEGMV
jgi:hypothetical protein